MGTYCDCCGYKLTFDGLDYIPQCDCSPIEAVCIRCAAKGADLVCSVCECDFERA